MYSGYAAGGCYTAYTYKGSPENLLCQIHNTTVLPLVETLSYIYGVEYEISGENNHADDHNMPFALCLAVGRSTMVMIPLHYECPAGWKKDYIAIYI